MRKRTQQSTLTSSSLAVDGSSNTIGRYCAHTSSAKNSWWKVDLTAFYEILEVVVTSQGVSDGIKESCTIYVCAFACVRVCACARVCVCVYVCACAFT